MATLTPRDTDFTSTAKERVVTERVAAGTPAEVWAVFTDSERWPEWFPAAKACRVTSDEPGGVGSTRWMHFDLFKVNERFIAWDEPERWAFTILDANLPGIISVVEQATFEPVGDDRTKVTYVLAADLAPYMRPAAPFLRWRLGKLFEQGLLGLDAQIAKLRAESA